MSCFSYTVNLNPFSPEAVDLSINNSTASFETTVDSPSSYLSQREFEPVDLPDQDDLLFWFDFSDPSCYSGSGSSFNNLAGDDYGGQVSIAVSTDSNQVLAAENPEDYFVNARYGKAFKFESGDGLRRADDYPFLTWENSQPIPDQYTTFLVVQNSVFEESINPVDQQPQDIDDLSDVSADAFSAQFLIRNGGGIRAGAVSVDSQLYSYPDYEYNGIVYPGYFAQLARILSRQTTFTRTDFDVESTFKIYTDGTDIVYNPLTPFWETYADPEGPSYLSGVRSRKLFTYDYFGTIGGSSYQIITASFNGDDMRIFLNGKFLARMPVANSGVVQANAGQRWGTIAVENNGKYNRSNFGGTYYAMGLYNKALSDEEQLQIYNYYRRDLERPAKEAVISVSERARYTMQTVIDDDYFIRRTGRLEYDVDLDLSAGSCEVSVDNPMSSTSTGVTPVDINVDLSTKSRDALVCPPFKYLWAFESDFSTATSNPWPMYVYGHASEYPIDDFPTPLAPSDVQQDYIDNLYEFSYNQVGPVGENGWLKVELKRDYKVGYATDTHALGGPGDGFGPFHFRTIPWKTTAAFNSIHPDDLKWTDKFDDYMSRGYDGRTTSTIYYSLSFKLAYSQAPPDPLASVPHEPNQPFLLVQPLANTHSPDARYGFSGSYNDFGVWSGAWMHSGADSEVTPGIVDNFFSYNKVVKSGGFVEWADTYIPMVPEWMYYDYHNGNPPVWADLGYSDFSFLRYIAQECVEETGLFVPQGFYIMVKDIKMSHFTAAPNLHAPGAPVDTSSKIPREEGGDQSNKRPFEQ